MTRTFLAWPASTKALDKRIYEIEDGREAVDDLTLQGLKLQRVGLKDEIADLLRKAGSA